MTADADFWNDLADEYAAKPVENPDAFERKIAITKSRMTPTDVVLDIGCGTGSLALRLAPNAAAVHGLDISREMIRIANEKTRAQGVTNTTFHVGPFDESFTAFEPGSLNGICAYSILHLIEDRAGAIERIYGLLAPGGFLVTSMVCLGESWVPYRPILTVMRWLGRAPMVKIIPKRTLVDELIAAGFVDLSQPDVGATATTAFIVATKPK